jgi:hypothetical protein
MRAPAGATNARVRLVVGTPGRTIYVDDFVLKR